MDKIISNKPMVHYRAIGFVILIFALSAFLPLSWVNEIPLCIFHYLTEFSCPGCGLTRSFLHFFHGYFIEAFYFNILGPAIILWMVYYGLSHAWLFTINETPPFRLNSKIKNIFTKGFIFLFLTQWSVKLFFELKDKLLSI